tara:strand:+ start:2830 stop:3420 length:591 start_codon:yes stop_codon:yes gene_type:complete
MRRKTKHGTTEMGRYLPISIRSCGLQSPPHSTQDVTKKGYNDSIYFVLRNVKEKQMALPANHKGFGVLSASTYGNLASSWAVSPQSPPLELESLPKNKNIDREKETSLSDVKGKNGRDYANQFKANPRGQGNVSSGISKANGYYKSNYFSLGTRRARNYIRNIREIVIRITDYDSPNSRSNWFSFINEQSVSNSVY